MADAPPYLIENPGFMTEHPQDSGRPAQTSNGAVNDEKSLFKEYHI